MIRPRALAGDGNCQQSFRIFGRKYPCCEGKELLDYSMEQVYLDFSWEFCYFLGILKLIGHSCWDC